MIKRWIVSLAAVALCLLVSGVGHAQQDKAKALELYDQATKKYNIGAWDDAVKLYKEAYDAYPAPEFLFNIGQSYRQKNDCKNGIFFYKRYLANKADAPNREQVEGFIRDLELMCKNQEQVRDKPPSNPVPPAGGTPDTGGGAAVSSTGTAGTTTVATASKSESSEPTVEARAPKASLVAFHADAGLGFVAMGDLDTTSQFSLKLGAGYPLALGPVVVEAGLAATLTTMQWENAAGTSGNSTLWSLLANARALYPLGFVNGLTLAGELGAGVLTFSGLNDDAAPIFLEPGMVSDGSPSMLNLRVAIGAEYALMPNLGVSVYPLVYSFSPAKDGFREDISSIQRFDFLVGVSYRL